MRLPPQPTCRPAALEIRSALALTQRTAENKSATKGATATTHVGVETQQTRATKRIAPMAIEVATIIKASQTVAVESVTVVSTSNKSSSISSDSSTISSSSISTSSSSDNSSGTSHF
eukprot:GHVT01008539.1.p3 GENE.GHVT01008539.1~~GHVT01008539.1.p3  ORF type:complete len:117 (-),score=16.01 GHVT01008539.1:703-1053(-)